MVRKKIFRSDAKECLNDDYKFFIMLARGAEQSTRSLREIGDACSSASERIGIRSNPVTLDYSVRHEISAKRNQWQALAVANARESVV